MLPGLAKGLAGQPLSYEQGGKLGRLSTGSAVKVCCLAVPDDNHGTQAGKTLAWANPRQKPIPIRC